MKEFLHFKFQLETPLSKREPEKWVLQRVCQVKSHFFGCSFASWNKKRGLFTQKRKNFKEEKIEKSKKRSKKILKRIEKKKNMIKKLKRKEAKVVTLTGKV